MRALRFPLWFVAVLVVLAGCRDGGVDDQAHDHEAVVLQVTAWSATHEIFIEFTPLVAGVASDLLTHVTDLTGGVPVTDGLLAYRWTHASGQVVEIDTPTPARDGLYITATTLPEPGLWTLAVRAPGATEPVALPEVRVYGNSHAAEHAPVDPSSEAVILLKEQQWRFGVTSEASAYGDFVPSVEIAAAAEAQPDRRTVVSTPVAGRLAPAGGRIVAAPGTRVNAGDVLGVIHAPLAGDGADLAQANVALVRAESSFTLAQAEVERALSLYEAEAAPARRVREAEAALAEARADLLASRQLTGANNGGPAPELPLLAPIDGIVIDVTTAVGEYAAAGAPVFTVLDPSQLWIRGWIPESALSDLPARPAALLATSDEDGPPRDLPSDDLIYLAPELDARTRSASIVYAVDNTDGRLRVGQSLSLRLQTARAENALTVPAAALVDEQGRPVVFVQTGGETFRKHPLVLGDGDGRRYAVLSGLKAGDRVVVSGAWVVKLASADDAIPAHGHTH